MLAKLRQVPAECLAEVSDFVDSVIERERKRHNKAFIDSIPALADEPFSRYWDNPIDAEYDKL
ncbi:MAG: toxin-antitoxin system, antitoxin component, Xre family protein [Thermoanaerobaculia bacterium]